MFSALHQLGRGIDHREIDREFESRILKKLQKDKM